ncbi:pumilio domain member 4 [Perkinsus chesapeaki]|uniref:Pumilio domain member 4 n=1 Tax=Perkinsus chesapeaki TaxID=330153 RepID=A0A7J6KZ04_PERCH|nr:pumilio domain member 4 [Perkinsus chesapeaki]
MAEFAKEAGGEIFSYNRENWKFNNELRQKNLYQQQKMRVRQVDLYREDLHDLFGLTIGKMDNYAAVSTILLVWCIEMFYKGRIPSPTQNFLFWAYAISLGSTGKGWNLGTSIVFLLFSLWFALHASVNAQVFSVRALTQWLRLPVPSAQEIADAASRLKDYEASGVVSMLRVPIVFEQARKYGHDLPKDLRTQPSSLANKNRPNRGVADLTTDWEVFLAHFNLFNMMHKKWQCHEAFARVCMCWGTNQLLTAMSYFSFAYYGVFFNNPWASYAYAICCFTAALIHMRINALLTPRENLLMIFLLFVPLALQAIDTALYINAVQKEDTYAIVAFGGAITGLVAVIFGAAWQVFFIYLCKPDSKGLPVKFSTVWCIDVMGFGVETMEEVAEPLAQPKHMQKGHLNLPSFPDDGPLNTYGPASDKIKFKDPKRGYNPDISEELRKQCKATERSLGRLFRHWETEKSQLNDGELRELDELKDEFTTQRKALAEAVRAEQGRGDCTPGTPFQPREGWIRLEYVDEDGKTMPYHLNCDTGEIQWEMPDEALQSRARGLSLIPEELDAYEEKVKAYKEVQKTKGFHLLEDNRFNEARSRMPLRMTNFGSLVSLLCWCAAIVDTALEVAKIDTTGDRNAAVMEGINRHLLSSPVSYGTPALLEGAAFYSPTSIACSATSEVYTADLLGSRLLSSTITRKCGISDAVIDDAMVLDNDELAVLSGGKVRQCSTGEEVPVAQSAPQARLVAQSAMGSWVAISRKDGQIYFTNGGNTTQWYAGAAKYPSAVSVHTSGENAYVLLPDSEIDVWSMVSGRFLGRAEIPGTEGADIEWVSACDGSLLGYDKHTREAVIARDFSVDPYLLRGAVETA